MPYLGDTPCNSSIPGRDQGFLVTDGLSNRCDAGDRCQAAKSCPGPPRGSGAGCKGLPGCTAPGTWREQRQSLSLGSADEDKGQRQPDSPRSLCVASPRGTTSSGCCFLKNLGGSTHLQLTHPQLQGAGKASSEVHAGHALR